jgi:hypothetical protein
LVRVETIVTDGGIVDERGGHQQRQHGGNGIEVLQHPRSIAIGVAKATADDNIVRRRRAKQHQADDEQEDPDHPAAQEIAEFEEKEGAKHGVLLCLFVGGGRVD